MRARLSLSHAQRVTRLYRSSLRTLDSWACDREIFLTRGGEIRARFDAAKAEKDQGTIERLLRAGEEELADWVHPDNYVRAGTTRGAAARVKGF